MGTHHGYLQSDHEWAQVVEEIARLRPTFLLVGMGQDYTIGLIRNITCPYATLTLERR